MWVSCQYRTCTRRVQPQDWSARASRHTVRPSKMRGKHMEDGRRRTGRGVVAPAEALTEADERELLSRIAERDRLAMRQFYVLYHRRIARFLTRITARRELVEEIVNDTLLIVWQRAAQFRGGSRIS